MYYAGADNRQPSEDGTLGAAEHVVDYFDVEHVAGILESKKIHTVTSTIAIISEAAGDSERALISAAEKSSQTKRFIASNWGGIIPSDE